MPLCVPAAESASKKYVPFACACYQRVSVVAQAQDHHALLFSGDNGIASGGLVAASSDLLVSIIHSHGRRLRLLVLNGCKTFAIAQAILLQCPTVECCVCWTTPVHSEAASIFANALADALAFECYVVGNDGVSAVSRAFSAAKAAVLQQVQVGHVRGVGPIGTPLYTFLDPADELTTYQACPCASRRCLICPCACPEVEPHAFESAMTTTRSTLRVPSVRWVGRARHPNEGARQLPAIAAGIPGLLYRSCM